MKRHWLWFATAAVSVGTVIVNWQKGMAITWAALAVVWTAVGVKKVRESDDAGESV